MYDHFKWVQDNVKEGHLKLQWLLSIIPFLKSETKIWKDF